MYCLVEGGVVTDGPRDLPTNWRNISNLPYLSDAELLPYGWLPVTPVTPPMYDPNTQSRTQILDISATAVVPAFVVKDLPPERVAAILVQRKASATNQVNTACGVFRASVGTDIPFQAEVYAEKRDEAANYIKDSAPDLANYPYLTGEAASTGVTVPELAQQIAGMTVQWTAVSAKAEATRRGAIVAIAAAKSVADVEAAIPANWP